MTITLGVLLAVVVAATGIAKVAALPAMRAAAAHLGFTADEYQRIGALEIAGAIGTVIGFKVAGIGIAAATGLVLLMLGAAGAHMKNHDAAARVVVPLAVAALAAAYALSL
jgi:hypothetical protein